MLQQRTHRVQGRSWFASITFTTSNASPFLAGPDTGYTFTVCRTLPLTPGLIGGTMIDFASLFRQWKAHSLIFRLVPLTGFGNTLNATATPLSTSAPNLGIAAAWFNDPAEWALGQSATLATLTGSGAFAKSSNYMQTIRAPPSKWLYTSATSSIDVDTPTAAEADEVRFVGAGTLSGIWSTTPSGTFGSSTEPIMQVIVDWDCSFRGVQEYALPNIPSLCRRLGHAWKPEYLARQIQKVPESPVLVPSREALETKVKASVRR
jgi:hypothetical protein